MDTDVCPRHLTLARWVAGGVVALAALALATPAGAATGLIFTVAGVDGQSGFSGDGGPATKALLNSPTSVAETADGGMLITDQLNDRIRLVSAGGVISTVAGGGPVCATARNVRGDGCPATQAILDHPNASAPLAGGGFVIADGGNSVIPEVAPAGIIGTIAGGATTLWAAATNHARAGRPATEALLAAPH